LWNGHDHVNASVMSSTWLDQQQRRPDDRKNLVGRIY